MLENVCRLQLVQQSVLLCTLNREFQLLFQEGEGKSIDKQINLYSGRIQINLLSLNSCFISNEGEGEFTRMISSYLRRSFRLALNCSWCSSFPVFLESDRLLTFVWLRIYNVLKLLNFFNTFVWKSKKFWENGVVSLMMSIKQTMTKLKFLAFLSCFKGTPTTSLLVRIFFLLYFP